MTTVLPFVSCLCPTFHRPKLLANALACFLAQDYPAARRELIILDDGNDFDFRTLLPRMRHDHAASVRGVTLNQRFPSLPEKFNTLAKMAQGEVFVVWEDDDIYLPHHISSHVRAMIDTGAHYSKPSHVLSTYTGRVETESAAGRFHASIAFSRTMFNQTDGWVNTKRADFDQQFLAKLAASAVGRIADPCQLAEPSYCFRYGSTQAYHGQHFMQSAADEGWYDRVPRQPGNRDIVLHPEFDSETRAVYASHSQEKAPA